MSLRLELSDLPPRYRAQAEQQMARSGKKKRNDMVDALADAAKAAAAAGRDFDSQGEYEYYIGTIAPKVARGEIVKWEAHPCFPLFPAGEYGGVKLRPVQYTADFRLEYTDGTVEIVDLEKNGQLMVQLINANGSHSNTAVANDDILPPVVDIELSIAMPAAPQKLMLRPENRELPFTYRDGRAYFRVDRLDLHSIVEVIE